MLNTLRKYEDLKSGHFSDVNQVVNAVEGWFSTETKDFYKKRVQSTQGSCIRCAHVNGDYVEKYIQFGLIPPSHVS